MKVSELKQYLSKWSEDEEVPVIGIELHKSEPMDAEMIRAAEEDEAAAGWIPVTKKLPKEDAWVLVAVKRHHWISGFGNENVPGDEKIDHPERIYYTLGRREVRDIWKYLDLESDEEYPSMSTTNDCRKEDLSYPLAEVLAWMPLPEPYRAV